MKKKIALCLIMGCLASTVWGCNAKDLIETTSKEASTEETADETDEETEGTEEEQEETKKKSSDTPVLGDQDIEDYEGFQYLYCEEIRTDSEKNEETGKMESKKLSVFVPESDYVNVSNGRVRSDKLGVTTEVMLEPYLRYDAEDYLMSENLQYYLEEEYDPFYVENKKDLVISDVEEIDDETAYATAEYCEYDEYDDDYEVIFTTYYLKKMDDGATVLVEIAVNSEEVTGKTKALIEELEAFYPFEIDWDKERAAKKLEDYLASDNDNTASTGYLLFELPDQWKKDSENSDFETYVYAPHGEADFAGCYVSIYRDYIGSDIPSGEEVEANQDEMIALVEELMKESDVDAKASYYGETCLGNAIKAEAEGMEIYWIFEGGYAYAVEAVQNEDAEADAFAVAEDILANGQVR